MFLAEMSTCSKSTALIDSITKAPRISESIVFYYQAKMLTSFIILSVLASAIAAPAPGPNKGIAMDNLITVSLKHSDALAERLDPRQEQCDVEYCQPLYTSCVKSCESLSNGNW